MQITRRTFIHSATLASAFLISGNGLQAIAQKSDVPELFPIPAEAYADPLLSMTAKQLDQFIGQHFIVSVSDGRKIELVLTEVNDLTRLENSTRGYYGDCFSMIFEGPGRTRLTQGKYEFAADGLPSFTALVVPTGRRQREYEIVINRLTR